MTAGLMEEQSSESISNNDWHSSCRASSGSQTANGILCDLSGTLFYIYLFQELITSHCPRSIITPLHVLVVTDNRLNRESCLHAVVFHVATFRIGNLHMLIHIQIFQIHLRNLTTICKSCFVAFFHKFHLIFDRSTLEIFCRAVIYFLICRQLLPVRSDWFPCFPVFF